MDIQLDGPILQLWFDRPDKRNALSFAILQELCQELEKARNNPDIRIVVIRGKGAAFSAGLDLTEMAQPELRERMGTVLMQVFGILKNASFVSIAVVHGAAVAGGAGLMAACDLSIASEECSIGFPELRRGVVAAQVATILSRLIAQGHLRELLLTGDLVTANRAQQMGLVNRVVPLHLLNDELKVVTDSILQGAPEAMVFAKDLIDKLYNANYETDMQHALVVFHNSWATNEAQEGIAAYNEHRPPSWCKN